VVELLARTIRKEKGIKGYKLSPFAEDMVIYLRTLKTPPKYS
jgi:hypothetical protein